jgi:hypothetical protein
MRLSHDCSRAVRHGNTHSEDAKPSHQLLSCFHGLLRIHAAKHFFPTFTIHRRQSAHELVTGFPFCVFAQTNAKREQSGEDPDHNVCRSDKKHTKLEIDCWEHSAVL